jgi:hypothetical protein
MSKKIIALVSMVLVMGVMPVTASDVLDISGFPKMKEVKTAVYHGIGDENSQSDLVCRVLQGIVNRDSAELFLSDDSHEVNWFKYIEKPFRRVAKRYTSGSYRSLRGLFGEYQDRIDKLVVCEFSDNSYTWNMAVMMASLENALPVSDEIKEVLVKEFNWKGEIVDIRNKWSSRKEAYEWALKEIMPKVNKQLVFSAGLRDDWRGGEWKIFDYVVATRSFCFWLDNHTTEGKRLIQRILREGNYPLNATVMGYGMHGDDLNDVTNPEGFGYVVGDFIPNVSFYSSLPNESFEQKAPKSVMPEKGKIYVALHFSDGDNIMFDHNLGYDIYNSNARGETPVTMTIAPTLTELAPFMIRYYKKNMTDNDELMGGPSGFQYIQEPNYKSTDYISWNEKNKLWLSQAGFTTTASSLRWPAQPFYNNGFLRSGVVGTLAWSNGSYFDAYDWFGMPIVVTGGVCSDTDGMYNYLTSLEPSFDRPKFTGIYMVQAGFGEKGYASANELRERLEKDYPGRFVFLKASDLLATAKSWFDSQRSSFAANRIPGTIEAEDFDRGGNNIAFWSGDNNMYNSDYRSDAENVNIIKINDTYGVRSVKQEWLSYTVDVEKPGTYMMQVTSSVPNSGEALSVMLDGNSLAALDVVGGQDLKTYSFNVTFPEGGLHELRVWFAQDDVCLDNISFMYTSDVAISATAFSGFIRAKHSNKNLAPISDDLVDGTNIVQKDDTDKEWTVSLSDDGYWAFTPSVTDKYLTCRAKKYVQLFDYNNTSELQKWTMTFVDDKHFMIGAKGTGLVIEVKDYSQGENAQLTLAAPTGADNQLFYFDQVSNGISETHVVGNEKATVWPNPFTSKVNISVPVHGGEQAAELSIFSVGGFKIYNNVATAVNGKYNFCWQPSDIESGIYVYNVIEGGKKFTGKLIKL